MGMAAARLSVAPFDIFTIFIIFTIFVPFAPCTLFVICLVAPGASGQRR